MDILKTLKSRTDDMIKILETYGFEAQAIKTLEELSECVASISRDLLKQLLKEDKLAVFGGINLSDETYTEIADSLVMLCQLCMADPDKVVKAINYKLDRQLKRMEG